MLKYEDFEERHHLREDLLDAVEILRTRNKHGITPTPDERRTMIFLAKSVERYLEAIKREALK